MPKQRDLGLAEAAAALKIPYQDAHRLLLTGRLQGEKRGGRWVVTNESVERVREDRANAASASRDG